jgi:hypothetical protein
MYRYQEQTIMRTAIIRNETVHDANTAETAIAEQQTIEREIVQLLESSTRNPSHKVHLYHTLVSRGR